MKHIVIIKWNQEMYLSVFNSGLNLNLKIKKKKPDNIFQVYQVIKLKLLPFCSDPFFIALRKLCFNSFTADLNKYVY